MHFPATMQRVHFRHQGYQIDCFRTSVDSNATHNKLFRVNRTSFIKVQQVKECLRLMGSKVQFLEIRLDEWRRQFVPELFKADFAAIITVDAGHQINKHVDKILLVLLAAAPQSGVHENASNHVQHGQDGKRHVEAQKQRHQRRVLGEERVRHGAPIQAAGDGLVKGHHRAEHRSVVLVGGRAHCHRTWIALREVGDYLREADTRSIDHQHEEDHRPQQCGNCLPDRVDQSPQFLDRAQNPHQSQDAQQTQDPQDPQETEAS
mmetsp:Transcript_61830/g.175626  ORF Transcript_61830/g.175626 Transcript_61830/m.175626 type:complete len:262 (-) Transcript_61830:249-1034(-)